MKKADNPREDDPHRRDQRMLYLAAQRIASAASPRFFVNDTLVIQINEDVPRLGLLFGLIERDSSQLALAAHLGTDPGAKTMQFRRVKPSNFLNLSAIFIA